MDRDNNMRCRIFNDMGGLNNNIIMKRKKKKENVGP